MGRITLDKSLIKELSELLNDNNLSEISVTQGRLSVKVARNLTSGGTRVTHVADKNILEVQGTENLSSHAGAVKSPMVGTVYLSSSPYFFTQNAEKKIVLPCNSWRHIKTLSLTIIA